jgi:eukaryotic-like serine/threonine-protein kinase
MADVYLAMSRTTAGLEKLAVIKRLRPDIGEDPEEVAHFKGMFWDEAKLAMLLNHSNVVHTHDAYEEAGALYLVMEYIEGQSLNTVLRELARAGRRLTPAQAALIMSEILTGLHYAHELKSLSGERLNIVHRDVSPQNILLSYDGNIKLVDFGVAMASTRSTETRAGTLKGKARYMAPEQVLNKSTLDRRADVYAVGVVLWELIAGRKMVAGANMVEQLVNVLKMEPERLSTVVPAVDPEIEAIVHKALARAPEDRYQTALAMRDALLAVANRGGEERAADIGVLVSELFAKRREEIASIVRERLALEATRESSLRMSAPDLPLMEEYSERSLPSALSSPRSAPSSSFTPHAVVQHVDTEAPSAAPQSSKKTVNVLVASLLALLLVVGGLTGVVVSNMGSNKTSASTPQAVAETKLREAPTPRPEPAPEEPKPAASTNKTPDSPKAPEPVVAPKVAGAPATPPVVVPRWTPSPAPVPAPSPQPDARPASGPVPAATAPEGEGFLTFDTYPWTRVSENGRFIANTPLVRVPMSAGTHVLTLENAQENVRQTMTIVIKPGETVSKRLAF